MSGTANSNASGATGTSIRIFLVDGTAEGLRLVEKSNWTGVGIVCPRSEYAQARKRDEFGRPGVYVLVGPGGSGLPEVYVGESEELRGRLDKHQQRKDFWTRVVAFTSKDGNLNKAHIRHLESRLIGLATIAKRAVVTNANAPAEPPLSEADTADTEAFLQEMLLIFPVLEVAAFQMSTATEAPEHSTAEAKGAPSLLYLNGPDTTATGSEVPEGFHVRTGSRGRLLPVPSMLDWLRNIRDGLLAQGILVQDGNQLVLSKDHVFDSPTSAAGVLLARPANGRTEWKDAQGKTLKALQIQALIAPPGD